MGIAQINRVNRMGLKYSVFRQGEHRVIVFHNKKSVVMDVDLDTFNQCWYNWYVRDMFIQDAFPMLPANHREFLMTGITPEEWDAMFPEETE